MPEPSNSKRQGSLPQAVLALLALALLTLGGGVALAHWFMTPAKKWSNATAATIWLPAIQRPPVVTAGDANLPDDAIVIGVSAGGRHRAYLLEALYPTPNHVINDLIGGTAITVTYCDMNDCLEVFTDKAARTPLELAVGGWIGESRSGQMIGSMLLRIGSIWYRQDTGQAITSGATDSLPYVKVESVRTSWQKWRLLYPDTDVYVGQEPALPH